MDAAPPPVIHKTGRKLRSLVGRLFKNDPAEIQIEFFLVAGHVADGAEEIARAIQ